ncbi:TPA: hypothetical protein ACHFX9_002998 [Citrobacter farmeri]|nr:hypothetical protein [Citrobacter farmeri]
MNIDRDFIHDVVYNFHASIMQDGELCDYSDISPVNENYDDAIYQKIYALKYIPAYYFEYCILANKLSERLALKKTKHVEIASFGCGLYPDYFALLHNLDDIDFEYYGFDICQWETRTLLPTSEDNIYLHTKSIDSIRERFLRDIDVFIFPKSLGDIAENIDIPSFADKIAKTRNDTIYFLNSFITVDHKLNKHHVDIFSQFHEAMLAAGFKTTDKSGDTFYSGTHERQGLKGIDYSFDYPQDIRLCEDKDKYNCECRVVHNPVLTNSYMNFQILEYTR